MHSFRIDKDFLFAEYPVLATLLRRQGTMGHVKKLQEVAFRLYEDNVLARDVYSLSPSQLEVLSYEYLRHTARLDFLHLPIGRTLQSVDIVGSAGSQRVYAQVTFAKSPTEVGWKQAALHTFSGPHSKKYFFAPRSVAFQDPEIEFIAIEDVIPALDVNPVARNAIVLILRQKVPAIFSP